jgi:hypothetical protein
MELFLIIVVCVLLWYAVAVVKELDAEAKQRSDDRVMADYQRAEDARYHRYELEAIDRAVQATIDDLDRIAAESRGEVIEGTAVEVRRP